jgi:hypothetical protein
MLEEFMYILSKSSACSLFYLRFSEQDPMDMLWHLLSTLLSSIVVDVAYPQLEQTCLQEKCKPVERFVG